MAAGSLFMVWGGPNDFTSNGLTMQTADAAVGYIMNIVDGLQAIGVQHIFVPGMPDLGKTPNYINHGLGTLGSQISAYFNSELVNALQGKGVQYFDTYTFMDNIIANPAKYGFTDVTDPCFDGVNVCSNPNQYLFWDDFHPTTYADSILAENFYTTVVPEPATIRHAGHGSDRGLRSHAAPSDVAGSKPRSGGMIARRQAVGERCQNKKASDGAAEAAPLQNAFTHSLSATCKLRP